MAERRLLAARQRQQSLSGRDALLVTPTTNRLDQQARRPQMLGPSAPGHTILLPALLRGFRRVRFLGETSLQHVQQTLRRFGIAQDSQSIRGAALYLFILVTDQRLN